MNKLPLLIVAALSLAGCKTDNLPPESRCTMYWDYYHTAGIGKPIEARQATKGVDFDDIRAIITADPSQNTRVCQKILNDAFPDDPALKLIQGPIPTVGD